MKKLILITLLMLSMVLPALAQEPTILCSGEWSYVMLDTGSAQIVSYNGELTDIVVPEMLDDIPVTAIGPRAFCTRPLTSLFVPYAITSVDPAAFEGCSDTMHYFFEGDVEANSAGFEAYAMMSAANPASLNYTACIPAEFANFDHALDMTFISYSPADLTDAYIIMTVSTSETCIIPSTIGERTVIGIAYLVCPNATSLVLPETLILINNAALLSSPLLQSVHAAPGSCAELWARTIGMPVIYPDE